MTNKSFSEEVGRTEIAKGILSYSHLSNKFLDACRKRNIAPGSELVMFNQSPF